MVLALPFTLLRDVRLDIELPAVKRGRSQELGYGTNAKLMVGFSERVWRDAPPRQRQRRSTDLPFQTTWETSRLQPGDGRRPHQLHRRRATASSWARARRGAGRRG